MADEIEEAQDEETGEEAAEGGGRRRLSGKVLVMAAAGILLLVGLSGGAVWLLDPFGGGGQGEQAAVEEAKPAIFYDMPELLVNLNNANESRSRFLKLRVALEMRDVEARDMIEPQLARIMDIFQVYLRELRMEDLEGSAGVYRLKEELLRRINLVLSPRRIDRVLFREMLVQ